MKTLTFLMVALFLLSGLDAKPQTLDEATGLMAGDEAPLFEAVDGDNNQVALKDLVSKGTVVLIFYRGAWCPYCNRHLSEIQEDLPMLYEKGVSVIAVTPEKPEYINLMEEKTGAKFTIVYDEGYEIAKAYKVNFELEEKKADRINKAKDISLLEVHQSESESPSLPIPATYIINSEGVIVWRHFDPNYRKRASVKDILEHIP